MSSPPWLGEAVTHPATINILQKSLLACMIGFTSPSSLLRIAVLPVPFILGSLILQTTALDGLNSNIGAVISALIMFLEGGVYLDQVVLSRWSFEAKGPTQFFPSKDPDQKKTAGRGAAKRLVSDSAWSRFLFGLETSVSWRHLNTPWEVNGCPQFSGKKTPSRTRFLAQAIAFFANSYLFLDFLLIAGKLNPPDINLFTPDKVPVFTRLGAMTAEDILNRVVTTVMHWAGTYCLLQAIYLFPAVLFVALGSEVKNWRPTFGSPSELYTVRKFWGSFWHQFLRHMFATPAAFIAHSVLRLPPRGLVQRYLKICIVFAISGLFHAGIDMLVLSVADSGSVRFFCTQALGIMVEDGVQEVWRRLAGDSSGQTTLWKRVVGFLWLCAFMAWSTPVWVYPYVVKQGMSAPGADPNLPLSLAARVLGHGKV